MLADADKRARYDRFGHAGRHRRRAAARRASTPTSSRTSPTSSATSSASAAGPRRGGPRAASDLRFDLEMHVRRVVRRAPKRRFRFRARRLRHLQGHGRGARHVARNVPPVPRHRPGAVPERLPRRRAHVRPVRRHRPDRAPPCAACRGTGRVTRDRRVTVRVPAGIADGQRLRIQGEGEHGAQRRPSGRPLRRPSRQAARHVPSRRRRPVHRRAGAVPRSWRWAASSRWMRPGATELDRARLGGHAERRLIPFRGKGMPNVSGRGRGTLYVRASVDVPRKLTQGSEETHRPARQDDAGREDRRAVGSTKPATSRSSRRSKTCSAENTSGVGLRLS